MQSLLFLAAALLLFWGLGDKYLWEDEAYTAVLARNMLQFGRPLAYDGQNLAAVDGVSQEIHDSSGTGELTSGAQAAVSYQVKVGWLRPDSSWTYQPWGQFAVAALGIALLGSTTIGARLPFALAGLATIILLYRLARAYCMSTWISSLAAFLLLSNTYWILHARQSRYYALSSLFLVITLWAYMRWQEDGRWGAVGFFLAAWCWFQVDYGTICPVLAVLFLDAFALRRRRTSHVILLGLALATSLLPFYFFYQLGSRARGPGLESLQEHLFNVNQYVAPALLLLVGIGLLALRWRQIPELERHLLLICCCIPMVLPIWVSLAAPASLVRYVIMAAPVGSLVAAWCFVRIAEPRPYWALLGAAVLTFTPWLCVRPVFHGFRPFSKPTWTRIGSVIRYETPLLFSEVFGHRPDPNRLVVEWLRKNSKPSDEIVVNYEDTPLMFYLPNPIRGGIAAFRVEDDLKTQPEFMVLRKSVGFIESQAFDREFARYQWEAIPLKAPDICWGNIADPIGYYQDFDNAPPLYLARRSRQDR